MPHTDYQRIMGAADANGWEAAEDAGRVSLSLVLARGTRYVQVMFDSLGAAESAAKGGPPGVPGLRPIRGPGLADKVIAVLGKNAAARDQG